MAGRNVNPISDGIREAIRSSGRSTYAIAKEVDCSAQQLYRFLDHERGLSQETLDRLGVALELQVGVRRKDSELVEESEEVQEPTPPPLVVPEGPKSPIVTSDDAVLGQRPVEPDAINPDEEPEAEKGVLGHPTPPPEAPPRPKFGGITPSLEDRPSVMPKLRQRTPRGTPSGISHRVPGKPGVVNRAATGNNPPKGVYDADAAATNSGPLHFNTKQVAIDLALKRFPDVKPFYQRLVDKRDKQGKLNVFNFIANLLGGPNEMHKSAIEEMPVADIVQWAQAFTPKQQDQISQGIVRLDDGEDRDEPFLRRIDKESFYKAVEKTFGLVPTDVVKKKRTPDSSPDRGT